MYGLHLEAIFESIVSIEIENSLWNWMISDLQLRILAVEFLKDQRLNLFVFVISIDDISHPLSEITFIFAGDGKIIAARSYLNSWHPT